MSKEILVSTISEGRARVTLTDDEGGEAKAEPFTRERKRIIIKGYALSKGKECRVERKASGFLIALPITAGSTPLVSLTLVGGDNQVNIVVDGLGLEMIMRHLLEALKIITSELEGRTK